MHCMNRQPGPGSSCRASRTVISISKWAAVTRHREGRVLSKSYLSRLGECWHDRASGLMFLEPGQYERTKLTREGNYARRACKALTLLAIMTYYRCLCSPNQKGALSSLKPMPPLLKGLLDSQ